MDTYIKLLQYLTELFKYILTSNELLGMPGTGAKGGGSEQQLANPAQGLLRGMRYWHLAAIHMFHSL